MEQSIAEASRPKRFSRFRKMVKRGVTYGKKKGGDLTEAFKNITLSPPKPRSDSDRSPLAPVSPNAQSRQSISTSRTEEDDQDDQERGARSEVAAGKQPERLIELNALPATDPEEITALTSLECVESKIWDFYRYWDLIEANFNVTKVAQGSYASVLRQNLLAAPGLYTIWKLMPLKPKKGKGSRRLNQTLNEDAAAEMKALALMSQTHGFVECRSARVLRGSLPEHLKRCNKDWATTHPEDADKTSYQPDQLWLMIELSDAGTDLESLLSEGCPGGSLLHTRTPGKRLTIRQTWDIFWGVAEALAHGEMSAQFEHRDLHPGNICIIDSSAASKERDQHQVARYTHLNVTLIDYTLSRATMSDARILSNTMQDETLFDQHSETIRDEQQYQAYRDMRSLVVVHDAINPRDEPDLWTQRWQAYVPLTNILWLHHILRLLLDETEFCGPGQDPTSLTKKDRKLAEELKKILPNMDIFKLLKQRYVSATELVGEQTGEKINIETFREEDFPGEGKVMGLHRRVRAGVME